MVNDQLILEAGRVKDGTRALVTGGGSGIGQSIAAALKSAGAGVLVCHADPSTNPDFVVDIVEEAAVQRICARGSGADRPRQTREEHRQQILA